MSKIEYALKLAKDCMYADVLTESAKEHLRSEIDIALRDFKNNYKSNNHGEMLTVDYLQCMHNITEDQAESLIEFAKIHTIRRKECYGDGSIIFPFWKKIINKNKRNENKKEKRKQSICRCKRRII